MSKNNPKITVITVCFNDVYHIESTIQSVLSQTYSNIEYIVVDGGSTDGTIEKINKYKTQISKIISEKDSGIYDAMNKGLSISEGEWVNFLNSGDIYADNDVLRDVFSESKLREHNFIYSDFYLLENNKKRYVPQDFHQGRVLHQSAIYRKCLHDKYGRYLVTKPYIVSDYLFFVQVKNDEVLKFNRPISINDGNGISMNGNWCALQKECVDFMFRKKNAFGLVKSILVVEAKFYILKLIRLFR